jgi:hypothetical protein
MQWLRRALKPTVDEIDQRVKGHVHEIDQRTKKQLDETFRRATRLFIVCGLLALAFVLVGVLVYRALPGETRATPSTPTPTVVAQEQPNEWQPAPKTADTLLILRAGDDLRAEPRSGATIVEHVTATERAVVKEQDGASWFRVATTRGTSGWVSSSPEADTGPTATAAAQRPVSGTHPAKHAQLPSRLTTQPVARARATTGAQPAVD